MEDITCVPITDHSFVPSNTWPCCTCTEGMVVCCEDKCQELYSQCRSDRSIYRPTIWFMTCVDRVTIQTGLYSGKSNGGWGQDKGCRVQIRVPSVTSSMVVNSHLSIHNRFYGFTSCSRTSTTPIDCP
ncbi:hypothetical protein TNCV_3648391 [Trichonephila clavipes]|nr:hypothetical protein TNCV_3648391 [Trichonephila clavipes]